MYRISLHGMETGVDVLRTHVPSDLELSGTSALGINADDQVRLYQAGYEIGLGANTGAGWRDTPPDTDSQEQVMPRTGLRFATRPREGGSPGSPAGAARRDGPGGGGPSQVPAINWNP